MVEINHSDRSMRAKIVYYGPATGGKTTNLQVIHRRCQQDKDVDLFSVDTAQNRTILFDLVPMSTPAFRNYQLRFQLLGVPGQKLYATTRKMLLKNTDAVVFVANSAADRWSESVESFKELTGFLLEHGIDPHCLPIVFQYNKRDLGDTVDVEIMERALNSRGASHFPAVASQEQGVLETFAAALKVTMSDLATRYQIASQLPTEQSIDEWAEQTMLFTFGVLRFDEGAGYVVADPSQAPAAAKTEGSAAPKVVRVRTPSKPPVPPTPRPELGKASSGLGNPPTLQPAAGGPAGGPPSPVVTLPEPRLQAPSAPAAQAEREPAPPLAPAAKAEPEPAPPLAPAQEVTWDTVSAASKVQDAFSAQAMVDSYAEAAVGLADHISDLREEKDSLSRRGKDFTIVSDTVKAILNGATSESITRLEEMVVNLAANWDASRAALYVSRSDGALQPLASYALDKDPLKKPKDPEAVSDGVAIQIEGRRVVQMRGEEGPLSDVIKRVGLECVAAAAFPLGTPNRRIGLLLFCFSQGAVALNLSEAEHLDRVAFELSLGLHVLSDLHGAFFE